MAPPKDPYKTLGVDKKASADEIKKAYRKLARQYHPDRNQGDKEAEERFKEIQQANDILSDPEKRKRYDSGGGIFGGFDPTVHEAISTRPDEEAEPGTVVDVVEKGYKLDDTVIRPARVVVAA